jgi:hypothetical protein
MADNYAIKLATDYLDRYFGGNHQATLIEMLEYADAHGKLVLNRDEVNEALNRRPSIFVERREGRILFKSEGTEQSITVEDHELSCTAYQIEFWERYRQLQNRNK